MFEDVAEAGAHRDPDLGQHGGRPVVGDGVGALAPHVRQRAVHRPDDVGEGDVCGRTGQPVAALCAALGKQETGVAESERMVSRNLAGMFCACAIRSLLTGPPPAEVNSASARMA